MLSKLASMFLANVFDNSKIIFQVKKRDARLPHFWKFSIKFTMYFLKLIVVLLLSNSVTALTNPLSILNF